MGQVQSLTEQTEGLVPPVDDKAAAKAQQTIDAGKESISSMITNFGRKITDPDQLGSIAAGVIGGLASVPLFGKVAKSAEIGLEALGIYDAASQGASTQQQMTQMGVPSPLASAAGTARAVGEIAMGSPQPVVADPMSSRPIERIAADDPEVAQSLQTTGQMKQSQAPVKIPDPVAPKPQMAAQGFVPVPEARANAMRGEATAMDQAPSFLYGGVVR